MQALNQSSRKFVFPVSKSLRVFAAILCFAVLPCLASAAQGAALGQSKLYAGYLDEAALVFSSETLKSRHLPSSILLPGLPPAYASDIHRACRAVHERKDDLLVYLPAAKVCLSLTELFDLAREFFPDQAMSGLLMRDRQSLMKGLETEALMVMQPKPRFMTQNLVDGVAAAEQCYCPNPTGDIFADGFESIP